MNFVQEQLNNNFKKFKNSKFYRKITNINRQMSEELLLNDRRGNLIQGL